MKTKPATAGERIKAIRGEMGQAEFGELLKSSQSAVSAWERDDKDRSPSATIFFRLAALARDSDDSIFFLQQAGLDKDAVISIAGTVLKAGGTKMDGILAVAEQKLREDEGKVVLVPPFTDGRWVIQKSFPKEYEEASRVPNKASTYYIIANAPTVYAPIGNGVAPGDMIIFDRSETSPDRLIAQEVLVESGSTLSIGRLVYPPGSPLALTLASDPPDRWHLVYLDSKHHPMEVFTGQILGRVVARYPHEPNEFWKRQASAPKAEK